MNISAELFELTPEQIETSKTMYNGKIIRCLVAPYHTYSQLERFIPYTESTFLFPEREMTTTQSRKFMSMVVNNPKHTDVKIITTDLNIICDMVGGLVRVLTERNEIVDEDCKTFAANIHDVKFNLLENEKHQLTSLESCESYNKINEMIKKLNNDDIKTQEELDEIIQHVDLIGEELIAMQMKKLIIEAQSKLGWGLSNDLRKKLDSGTITTIEATHILDYMKSLSNKNELRTLLNKMNNVTII